MSEEDAKWLEEALKEYTFNDTDKLTEICEELKKDVKDKYIISKDEMLDRLDQLSEIVELHERNNLNLFLTGGLQALLQMAYEHPESEVRQESCLLIAIAL